MPAAILFIICSVVLFAVMDGIAKLLTGDYSIVQVVWARYAFAVPVVLATARPAAWPKLLGCERPALQAGRSLLPVLANTTAVVAGSLMPLADATAITFTHPLLVVALSAPILGERLPAQAWLGVAAGFAGVLTIVRPGAGALVWAALFPLATAFLFALYQVLTRLVGRDDAPVVTFAWTIVVGLVATSAVLPLAWHGVSGKDWLLLILSGLLFGGGQFFLIRAFAMASGIVLAPFTYVQIVAAVIFGALVFEEMPDFWTLVGMALIVLAGVHVMRRQAGAPSEPKLEPRAGP